MQPVRQWTELGSPGEPPTQHGHACALAETPANAGQEPAWVKTYSAGTALQSRN